MQRAIRIAFVLCLLIPASARAVDVSGAWQVDIGFSPGSAFFSCRMTFTTEGTSLTIVNDCPIFAGELAGTVDSTSGAFTAAGSVFLCDTLALAATANLDGTAFAGTMSCGPDGFSFFVDGFRCGNGVLDAGESCDDGNRLTADCCSDQCSPEPAGASCDDGNVCVRATCDGAGTCDRTNVTGPCDDFEACTTGDTCTDGFCLGFPAPEGSACDDFDACTGDGTCSGGFCDSGDSIDCGPCRSCDFFEGCVDRTSFACDEVPASSRLRISDAERDRDDAFRLRWVPGTPIDIAELGDPRRSTSWDVCVRDDYGFGRLIAGVRVPAGESCGGRPCWRGLRDGYRYGDPASAHDGVRAMTLRAGPVGRAQIDVRARGVGLDPGPLPATLGVVAQVSSSEGTCWQTTWDEAIRNGPLDLRLTEDDR